MQLAAYYFPNYHIDPRNEAHHGPGWTEWELMKYPRPRFSGHKPAPAPLWGYEDEASPDVMARKIDAAADAGIDAFVFDWYWYDGPYLQRALDEGFLQAPNREKLRFAIMWANHDWFDRHPIGYTKASHADLLYPCNATTENIGEIWDYLLEHYLTRPEYWRVEGKPYFSIYAVTKFIKQMGGPEETARVLALLRDKAKAAGLPGLYLNAVWYDNLTGHPFTACPQHQWHTILGFDSYTSYNSVSTTPIWQKEFPLVDFNEAAEEYIQLAAHALETLPAPYFPVVTAGWDSTPRAIPSDIYRPGPYPYNPVMPSSPEGMLKEMKKLGCLLEQHPKQPQLIFINAWNEWTEGSYLEPDVVQGDALLKAIRTFRDSIGK